MSAGTIFLLLIVLSAVGYFMTASRVRTQAAGGVRLHSLPSYHGYYVAMWTALPVIIIYGVWIALEPGLLQGVVLDGYAAQVPGQTDEQLALAWSNISNVASGLAVQAVNDPMIAAAAKRLNDLRGFANLALTAALIVAFVACGLYAWGRVKPQMRARQSVERTFDIVLIIASTIAIMTTVGIVLSLLYEASRFFLKISPTDFFLGTNWKPNPFEEDPAILKDDFGFIPLFTGTMLITIIAMLVAVPVGLFSAIYLSDYAPQKVRSFAKPALEVLAGIPTVVYGVFALLTVAPIVADAANWVLGSLGLLSGDWVVPTQSALAAGVVMGIMIVPFVSSLIDDVINAVPRSLRDGSSGLGATKSETMRLVVLPAALPGIVAAVMLAISKAIGETMIVVMAAGTLARLSVNPLEAVTTVTVQIEKALTGDQPFDSPATLSAFALGLVLFAITLVLNIIALRVVNKYRERYD